MFLRDSPPVKCTENFSSSEIIQVYLENGDGLYEMFEKYLDMIGENRRKFDRVSEFQRSDHFTLGIGRVPCARGGEISPKRPLIRIMPLLNTSMVFALRKVKELKLI
jgi:hypothetical protein